MRKAKTPLLRSLHKSLERKEYSKTYSRRDFLQTGAKAAVVATLPLIFPSCFSTDQKKKTIAILGGGIAGLTAIHYLHKAGLSATIYEATNRTGGRMYTAQDKVAPGITTEIGGEFIDSNHEEIRALAEEFGLKLKDHGADPLCTAETKETYYIFGKEYNTTEVITEFNKYTDKIHAHQEQLGEDYDTEQAIALDAKSIAAYFDELGMTGWFRTLLEAAYKAEFGAECSDQSALNFLSMISTDTSEDFNVFGESDERYGIEGGNDLLPKALSNKYKKQIITDHFVTDIQSKNKGYEISFKNGKTISADYVICTIPFSVLRGINLNIDGMTVEKKMVINELGYGDNAKLILGMNERIWRTKEGVAGYVINEQIHNGWDSSQGQNNNQGAGAYTVYTSTADALTLCAMMDKKEEAVEKYLPLLDTIFPGAQKSFNQKTLIANWPAMPTIKGAYSYYKPGQWTNIAGNEATPVGNLYFAGEHCSTDFQGYMNGGAQSGKDAALAVAIAI